jgi:hypothetical protein
MKVICAKCGTEFEVFAYRIKNGGGKFCSRACAGKAKRTQVNANCLKCGSQFKARESRVKKGQGKYCSLSCAGKAKGIGEKANCIKCGSQFKTIKALVKKGWGKYCSRACAGTTKGKQGKANCIKCGSEFRESPYEINVQGRKYCSIACSGHAKISKLELMNDLRRVAHQLGHRPTMSEYSRHGKYSTTIITRMGGIQAVWESMGLLFKDRNSIPSTNLNSVLADLQRLRKQLGHLPTVKENDEFGHHYYYTIFKYLEVNSWYEVLIKAFDLSGLEEAKVTPAKHRTLDMWLLILRHFAQGLGRVPFYREARTSINWRPNFYPILQGKSFKSFLEAAGIDARKRAARIITDEELIADVIRVAKQLRKVPTGNEYTRHGGYQQQTVARHIGWGKAQELAAQAIQLHPVNQAVKELSAVPEPLRDKLKESSVEAIRGFFQVK